MSTVDWAIIAAYLGVVLVIGWFARRPGGAARDEFFLAGRTIPAWAAAMSVLATTTSAVTFIGVPEQAYGGNLTYLTYHLGALIAIAIVALTFIPAYYRHNVTSVYELLGHEYGSAARRAASAMFMLGRVLASGARLFVVGIPVALITFGTTEPAALIGSIALVAVVATAYTLFGGIRAVIYTDVLQASVLVVSACLALGLLLEKIPLSRGQIIDALASGGPEGTSKLTVIDLTADGTTWYTLWTALFGWSLFNLAAYGADQDLVQRMLTCRSARAGSTSAVLSILITWPVVALFLVIGLLLSIYYGRPDLMGAAAPGYAIDDPRRVFIEFILAEMGPGLRGLMIAGLLAAAMGSLDSVLNALAAATIADFWRPWRARRAATGAGPSAGAVETQHEQRVSRWALVGWSIVLAAFACACVYWQRATERTLIEFALGVMVYAYTGLLGVFLTAFFTRRGNAASVLAALLAGLAATIVLDTCTKLVTPWTMLIGTAASFLVCCTGRRPRAARPTP